MKKNKILSSILVNSPSKFALKTLVLACALTGSMSIQAGTLFSQAPTYSSLVASYESTLENGLWVPKYYDNFTLGSTNTINEISWVGGFSDSNSASPPPSPPSTGFTVSIFANNSGTNEPTGSALYSTTVAATANQVFNQNTFVDPLTLHFYDYRATLPSGFLANAGTVYWLSVQANTGIEWDWATAGSGRSIVDVLIEGGGGITRLASQNNLAFSIYNNTQNVPEPDSFALAGIGMLAWWGSSQMRKSSK